MPVSEKVVGAVGIVVVVIVLLAMTSTVVDQVQAILKVSKTTATAWNFTGYAGAQSLLGLVPFVWVASVLVCAAVGMFAMAKHKDKE